MATSESTEAIDAIQLLVEDHQHVEEIFVTLESGTFNPDVRADLISDLVRELSVHAAVEEQVLYPAMREALPDGDEQVDHAIEEHQEVKDKLAAIEDETGGDGSLPAVSPLLQELMDSVRHHVEEEEGELFPQLKQAISEDQLRQMGQAMASAKRMAPTHPHPKAPNTPPGNVVAGAVAGVTDRIKDAVRKK
jgi:hemerythrin-like domain-containing protein